MIDSEEAAAIERFTAGCTIPLFYEKGDEAPLFGSATLLKVINRHFLITAAHLFEEPADVNRLAFPESPTMSGVFTLGQGNIWKPDEAKTIDVAAIELLENETVEKLSTGWAFLSLDMIAAPSWDGTFFLSGYPASLTEKVNRWLVGRFVTIFSSRLKDAPFNAEPPIDMTLDLFFDYATESKTLDGKTVSAPELPGVSGASIWEFVGYNGDGIWTPDKAIRVVGVQSAYTKGKYFRGKAWNAVASVLAKIDHELGEEVRSKVFSTA